MAASLALDAAAGSNALNLTAVGMSGEINDKPSAFSIQTPMMPGTPLASQSVSAPRAQEEGEGAAAPLAPHQLERIAQLHALARQFMADPSILPVLTGIPPIELIPAPLSIDTWHDNMAVLEHRRAAQAMLQVAQQATQGKADVFSEQAAVALTRDLEERVRKRRMRESEERRLIGEVSRKFLEAHNARILAAQQAWANKKAALGSAGTGSASPGRAGGADSGAPPPPGLQRYKLDNTLLREQLRQLLPMDGLNAEPDALSQRADQAFLRDVQSLASKQGQDAATRFARRYLLTIMRISKGEAWSVAPVLDTLLSSGSAPGAAPLMGGMGTPTPLLRQRRDTESGLKRTQSAFGDTSLSFALSTASAPAAATPGAGAAHEGDTASIASSMGSAGASSRAAVSAPGSNRYGGGAGPSHPHAHIATHQHHHHHHHRSAGGMQGGRARAGTAASFTSSRRDSMLSLGSEDHHPQGGAEGTGAPRTSGRRSLLGSHSLSASSAQGGATPHSSSPSQATGGIGAPGNATLALRHSTPQDRVLAMVSLVGEHSVGVRVAQWADVYRAVYAGVLRTAGLAPAPGGPPPQRQGAAALAASSVQGASSSASLPSTTATTGESTPPGTPLPSTPRTTASTALGGAVPGTPPAFRLPANRVGSGGGGLYATAPPTAPHSTIHAAMHDLRAYAVLLSKALLQRYPLLLQLPVGRCGDGASSAVSRVGHDGGTGTGTAAAPPLARNQSMRVTASTRSLWTNSGEGGSAETAPGTPSPGGAGGGGMVSLAGPLGRVIEDALHALVYETAMGVCIAATAAQDVQAARQMLEAGLCSRAAATASASAGAGLPGWQGAPMAPPCVFGLTHTWCAEGEIGCTKGHEGEGGGCLSPSCTPPPPLAGTASRLATHVFLPAVASLAQLGHATRYPSAKVAAIRACLAAVGHGCVIEKRMQAALQETQGEGGQADGVQLEPLGGVVGGAHEAAIAEEEADEADATPVQQVVHQVVVGSGAAAAVLSSPAADALGVADAPAAGTTITVTASTPAEQPASSSESKRQAAAARRAAWLAAAAESDAPSDSAGGGGAVEGSAGEATAAAGAAPAPTPLAVHVGADDLMPRLIFVLACAWDPTLGVSTASDAAAGGPECGVPKLARPFATLLYCDEGVSPERALGEDGYALVSLRAAAMHLQGLAAERIQEAQAAAAAAVNPTQPA